MVASAEVLHGTPDYSHITEDLDDMSDKLGTPEDEMDEDNTSWEQPERLGSAGNANMAVFPQAVRTRMQAPELRRTSSMPVPMQVRPDSRPQSARPHPIDIKVIQDDPRFSVPNGPPTASNPEYKALVIGNTPEVAAFLETRFRQLQQLVCKIVAKAWIKVIEPKKQTRYPYNKGEESKPTWWPSNVRHKEPDHLMKPERITLLMTMLRCGKVATNRLELATAEVAAFIPPDKINLLREIYRVGREEERYKAREIPADTRIFVSSTAYIGNCDEASPSTAGMRGDMTPRSAAMTDAHMSLQRSTSRNHYEEDHFATEPEMAQGFPMIPPQQFYYQNDYPQNSAVMSTNSAQAQQFQQAQQQQMYAAQQAQARRASNGNTLNTAWPQNADQWHHPPASIEYANRALSMDHSVPVAAEPEQFFPRKSVPETPKRQVPEQTNQSSPYLPTPMRGHPDVSFSAQRQGVSFSDYIQSPRTGPAEANIEEHQFLPGHDQAMHAEF